MFHLNHGYVTCLYNPIYLIGDVCTEFVAILLVYVSVLACCSALCLFEKHMLAFVDLIHALPTRGRDSNPILALGINVQQGGVFTSKGEMHLFMGSLHSCRGSSLCHLNFSCARLLMVLSPFASP
jgi:hypothetical protein